MKIRNKIDLEAQKKYEDEEVERFFLTDKTFIPQGCEFSELNREPEGIEESFKDRKYTRVFNERIDELVPHTDTSITYNINEQGYRAPEFTAYNDSALQVLCFGCSYTFGVGVKEEETWPSILKNSGNLPSEAQVWNLGVPGSSNDSIVRRIYHAVRMMRPNVIFVQWTIPHRREYVEYNGEIRKILTNHPKFWIDNSPAYRSFMELSNPAWDQYYWEKNVAFMEAYTKMMGCTFVWGHIADFPFEHPARDTIHPGAEDHEKFAKIMYQTLLDISVFWDSMNVPGVEWLKK